MESPWSGAVPETVSGPVGETVSPEAERLRPHAIDGLSSHDHRLRALEDEVARLAAEVAQLHRALATRTLIGQATGVVMSAFGCPAAAAWQALRAFSQDSNTPVRELAASIVSELEGGSVGELISLRRYL